MTGVSECSQQRSNLKDDGYKPYHRGHIINKIVSNGGTRIWISVIHRFDVLITHIYFSEQNDKSVVIAHDHE
ncbi:hypothetical protein [Photorhabdus bodei]|uniref:hypothetical protein n=1 Tax=Photorhabdus bodei TaxID=2029681 RepID=UPI00142E8205